MTSNAIIAELSKRLAPASEYMAKVQAQQSRERVRRLEAESAKSVLPEAPK